MPHDKPRKTPKTPATPQPPEPPEPAPGNGTVHIERYEHSRNAGPPPKTPTPPVPPGSARAAASDAGPPAAGEDEVVDAAGIPVGRAYVRKQAAIFLKQVSDHYVLYDPLAQTFLRLNRPALSIWQAIGDEERRYVPEIVSDLRDGEPALAEGDIEATLAAFIDNGVLTVVSTNRE